MTIHKPTEPSTDTTEVLITQLETPPPVSVTDLRNALDLPVIPCLSLRQPWGSVMLHGPKDLENRPWRTGYRGVQLVHASMTKNDISLDVFTRIRELWPAFDATLLRQGTWNIPRGCILGIVKVAGCVRPESVPQSPWAWGPWCHQWPRRSAFLRTIPYSGSRDIFPVPTDLVREQIEALITLQEHP